MRLLSTILLLGLTLTSCFEEDEMVPPHEQGELKVGSVALGPTYANQVYYSLATNGVVASNNFTDWDLSFESAGGGWTVRLNSARFMVAGNSLDTAFAAELSPQELEMNFDPSSGNPDSTAIGSWYVLEGQSIHSLQHVYLIDRGINKTGQKTGYKKVRLDVSGTDYSVRFANTDNSADTTLLIPRDENKAWIHFSFETGVTDTSPDADSWSLLFTRYTTMLVTNDGENYPYLVTGALLNPGGVNAILDTIHDFQDMVLADTVGLELTTRADVIGYDWKYYNFDAGLYTMVPEYSYVIRDRDGFFYKLRFIDFYNDTGEKGYPEFEYVKL